MKKLPKLYWIISAVLTVAGISVMTAGAIQVNQENQNIQPTAIAGICPAEDLTAVVIDVNFADVILEPSADDTVSLTLSNEKLLDYGFDNGTLRIGNRRRIFFSGVQFINIGAVQQKNQIVLSLPEKQYDKITLSSGAGDMNLSGVNAGMLAVSAGAGTFTAEDSVFDGFQLESGAGDIHLNKTEVKSDSETALGAGNFTAENCSFAGISIQNGAGDVKLQNSGLQGNADLTCGAGDISLTIPGQIQDYQIDCSDCLGDVNIQNNSLKSIGSESAQYQIEAHVVGDVDIIFTE